MAPRTLVVGLALLALMPLVAANQAPVAMVSAQSEAVLGEPVVFTDASIDADGTIVHREWEFSSDGRTVVGNPVTYHFDWPGIHTITLRVRDDQGAWSSVDFPLLVHAPLMHGRATALRVGDARFADTGDVVTQYQEDHADDAASDVNYGQLRVAGVDATLRTLDNRAVARADVGYVYIPLIIGYALVTGIEAESIVGCDFPTIVNAKFSQIRLNDGALVPPGDVPPNTSIPLAGGALLELNVQEAIGDRLAVTALRYTSVDGSVVEIAHAEAGVTHCPWRG